MQQTAFSSVAQSRAGLPNPIGGLVWYGMDDSYTSCYLPFYCSIESLPKSFTVGTIDQFSWDSAWWVFDVTANYAYGKYSYMMPEIRAAQKDIESNLLAIQPAVEKTAVELAKTDPKLATRYLTDYSMMHAELTVRRWRALFEHLVMKYNDGYVREQGRSLEVGYPEPWLAKWSAKSPTSSASPRIRRPIRLPRSVGRAFSGQSAPPPTQGRRGRSGVLGELRRWRPVTARATQGRRGRGSAFAPSLGPLPALDHPPDLFAVELRRAGLVLVGFELFEGRGFRGHAAGRDVEFCRPGDAVEHQGAVAVVRPVPVAIAPGEAEAAPAVGPYPRPGHNLRLALLGPDGRVAAVLAVGPFARAVGRRGRQDRHDALQLVDEPQVIVPLVADRKWFDAAGDRVIGQALELGGPKRVHRP